ncbi:MAG: methylated-DNA--[protein]-cysteine S-methyltransferase [Thermodesulfobacteriota bacterium]
MHIQYTVLEAPPGPVFLAETRQGVLCVSFGPQGLNDLTAFARRWHPEAQIIPSVVESTAQVQDYLDGKRREFKLTLDLKGTEFQRQVWRALSLIPYGQTSTYGRIAERIGRPGAARAVGQACGANPIPLIIPCHRVLASNGGLGGFGSGLHWKRWLLNLESH